MQDNFLQVAHTLDLLADHPESFIVTQKAIYYVPGTEEESPEIIPISPTDYATIRQTLIYTFRDKE